MQVVEFMGIPKAGKSTQLDILENFLKHEAKKQVRTVYEGARVCPIDKQDRFQYNAWSFHNTTNRIMEAKLNGFDYILIDRGVYDHIAFSHALYKQEQITRKQYEAQTNYFEQFNFLEDLVLAFMVTPEEALKRETKHHNFVGRVMNNEFLKQLHKSYNLTLKKYQ